MSNHWDEHHIISVHACTAGYAYSTPCNIVYIVTPIRLNHVSTTYIVTPIKYLHIAIPITVNLRGVGCNSYYSGHHMAASEPTVVAAIPIRMDS